MISTISHELSCDGSRWFYTMDLVRGRDFLDHVRGDATLGHVPLCL